MVDRENWTTRGIRAAVRRMSSAPDHVQKDVLEMHDPNQSSLATTEFYQAIQQ